MTDPMLAHALRYAAMGWPVFPVGRDKRPFAGTHGLKDASADPTAVRTMWAQHPNANIAVRTGEASGLYVVDVDVANGKLGESSLADLEREHGEMPDTLMQRTGRGGWQYVFRYPKDGGVYPNTESKLALHVDTRGEGGYIVVPPSETDGRYQWVEEFAIADVPAWVLPRVRRVATLPPDLPPADIPTDMAAEARSFAAWASKADAAEGQRNKRAFVIACEGLGRRLPLDVVRAVVADYCARSGLPLDEGEACLASAASSPRVGNPLPKPTQAQLDAMGDWTGGKRKAEPEPVQTATAQDEDDGDGNKAHFSVMRALTKFFDEGHLAIDAVGGWRDKKSWELTDFNIPRLANLFAMDYREKRKVTRSYVIECMETVVDLQSNARRKVILGNFFGHAKTIDGVQSLQTWVHAVTGDLSDLDVAVMRQFLWCVKRKMAGLRVEHHIMPILQGPQGSGKSRAIRALLEPLQELWKPCAASMLTDARETPSLATYYVGFWDEMEGVEKVAAEALKQTITAEEKAHRPLHTNRDAIVPVRCSFIAATNEEVAGLVGDTTGSRRFYAIKTADRCDWETINAIDYVELWRSVDESEEAPLVAHLDEIREVQAGLRKLDSVAMWLADEDWKARSCHSRDTNEKVHIGDLPEQGEPFDMVRLRYADWCARHAERPVGTGIFCRRLAGEGVGWHFPRIPGQTRVRLYTPGSRTGTRMDRA